MDEKQRQEKQKFHQSSYYWGFMTGVMFAMIISVSQYNSPSTLSLILWSLGGLFLGVILPSFIEYIQNSEQEKTKEC